MTARRSRYKSGVSKSKKKSHKPMSRIKNKLRIGKQKKRKRKQNTIGKKYNTSSVKQRKNNRKQKYYEN